MAGLYAALYGTVIKDFPWNPEEQKTELLPELIPVTSSVPESTASPMPSTVVTPAPTSTLTPMPTAKEELKVSASYTNVPAFTDVDTIIYATTSIRAAKVTLVCSAGDKYYGTWDMKTSDYINWTFNADFYEVGTFIITITAYDSGGYTSSTTLTIVYDG